MFTWLANLNHDDLVTVTDFNLDLNHSSLYTSDSLQNQYQLMLVTPPTPSKNFI